MSNEVHEQLSRPEHRHKSMKDRCDYRRGHDRISYLTNNLSQKTRKSSGSTCDARLIAHSDAQQDFRARNGLIVGLKPQQSFTNRPVPDGRLITCDYLHRVFKKVISACLSSELNSLKRLAGSRASP
jgi:hypothetical protein